MTTTTASTLLARVVPFTRPLICATLLSGAAGSVAAGDFDCLIEPRQLIEIRSGVQGLIEKVWVDRGDVVKPGQVLVTLDSGPEKAAVELARFRLNMTSAIRSSQSRLEWAELKFNRKDKLVEQSYISAQDRDEAAVERRLAQAALDEAKDNLRLAQLEYQRASEQLRQRTVVSPVAGLVVDRMMHPGELADTGDIRRPILKIADVAMLYVEVLLPIEVFGAVKAGDTATVTAEVAGVGAQQARVKTVDQVLDAASGTFRARLELPNPGLKLPGGVKCIASFPNVKDDLRTATTTRLRTTQAGRRER